MYLCRELWREIWSYDLTYHILFDTVVQDIKLRYDDGRWWIRQSGLLVLGSRKLFENNSCKKVSSWSVRSYYELNFLTRDNDYSISMQFFRLQDVLREFKRKISVVS